MLGAIAGDIIGSVYEWNNIKTKDFDIFAPEEGEMTFTDDTVMTVALMEAILASDDYGQLMKNYYHKYRGRGYGGHFGRWCRTESAQPYRSYGNGSAMRTSAVGWAFDTLDQTYDMAASYASFTHNHYEGMKGAMAISTAIFMARNKHTKDDIRNYITSEFNYDLNRTLDEIRPDYEFDVSCQGSVPEAIIAFLESTDFEDAIKNAISIGGDSDTIACMAGGIAEAYYGPLSVELATLVFSHLDRNLTTVVREFYDDIGRPLEQLYPDKTFINLEY